MNKRHIVSVSGGKDSAALAIYMKDKIPNVEYVFCDTGCELPETYEYLDKLERFLGAEIIRIRPEKSFEELLKEQNGFLPGLNCRWCTRHLKILPIKRFYGKDDVINYVGIRADEAQRTGRGFRKTKRIISVYPFVEAGIDLAGVNKILADAGIGLPGCSEWRSHSSCYFCPYQRVMDWIGLLERHPELFEKAKSFEGVSKNKKYHATWRSDGSLAELAARAEEIKARHKRREEKRLLIGSFL